MRVHALDPPVVVGYAMRCGLPTYQYPELRALIEQQCIDSLPGLAARKLYDLKWGAVQHATLGEVTRQWSLHHFVAWTDDEGEEHYYEEAATEADATVALLLVEAPVLEATWSRR